MVGLQHIAVARHRERRLASASQELFEVRLLSRVFRTRESSVLTGIWATSPKLYPDLLTAAHWTG